MALHPGSLSNAYAMLQEHGFSASTIQHVCEVAADRGSYSTGRATVTFDREWGYRVTTRPGLQHSLDRIERNAAAEADLTNSQAELAAELETAAETPAPLPRRMGRLSEAHVNTIASALASQRIQFAKLSTGGTEATDEYFTTRLAEVETAYDAVIHFGAGGL